MDETITEQSLRKLHELSVAIGIESDPGEVAAALLRGVLEITRADAGLVILRGDDDAESDPVESGLAGDERDGLVELLRRLCAENALTGPIAAANLQEDERLAPAPTVPGPVAFFAAPLAKRDCEQLGALTLIRKPPRRVFTVEESHLIEMLIGHATTAIENARLQLALRERAERTEVLNEIARALATTTDVARIFPRITGAMRRLIQFDLTTLVAVDERADTAHLVAFEAADYPEDVGAGFEVPIPLEFAALVETRRAITLGPLGASSHPSWLRMVEAGIQNLMAAPLLSGRQVPAVLVVGSRDPDAFGPRAEARLQAIADQLAPAIEGVRLHQALRESRALYETLLQAVPDPITVTDLEGRITYATERAVKEYGAGCVEDLMGVDSFELIAPEYVEKAQANAMRTLQEGISGTLEYELLTRQGERRSSELSAALVHHANGQPRGFIAITRDITARKQAEASVRSYQEKLRSLAAELSLAEERQRQHIAAELHDEISQTLVLVKLKLSVLRDGEVDPALSQNLEELRGIVDQTIGRVQSLIWEISSPILSELGLEAAVQWLAGKLSRLYGIEIDFHDDVADKSVAEDIRLVLFQAVRELLVNVSKHARAEAAKVTMRRDADELQIEVSDDGVGFDPIEVGAPRATTGGFGLFSIRERLGYLGGRVEVDSSPGAGTRVRLSAPVA